MGTLELSLKDEGNHHCDSSLGRGSVETSPWHSQGRGCPRALPVPWGVFIQRANGNLLSGCGALACFFLSPCSPFAKFPTKSTYFYNQKTSKFSFNLWRPFPGVPSLPQLTSSAGLGAQWRPRDANGDPRVSKHMPPG